jgi:pyruvate formate lyase activating enzyme
VRFNRGGRLLVPYGYACGLRADPIEKKPFFHALPGSSAMSFGMLGCNFRCPFCQNWRSSQALRDPRAWAPVRECGPGDIVEAALSSGCRSVISTYNEPWISAEWAADVFRLARERGLRCGAVSNGHASREGLDFLGPLLDFCKVDLKCFDERRYRDDLGGSLRAVRSCIEGLAGRGVWVEAVTLVVPGFNDSDAELSSIARFLAGVSRDLPWHASAFHGDYRMEDREPTPAGTIERAAAIGRAQGLRFVYAGNLPGAAGLEDTHCPGCRAGLVERRGFGVLSCRIRNGRCPECSRAVPGAWD